MIALATQPDNITPDLIRAAMLRLAVDLAEELPDVAAPDRLSAALRQPVTLAAVYTDLCAALGIAVPYTVSAALDAPAPVTIVVSPVAVVHADAGFGDWDDPEHLAPRPTPIRPYCPSCEFPYDAAGRCDCSRWSWEAPAG